MALELRAMNLAKAVKKIVGDREETLPYYADFPSGHWRRIRTNSAIGRLNQEICCCT